MFAGIDCNRKYINKNIYHNCSVLNIPFILAYTYFSGNVNVSLGDTNNII